MTLAPDLIALEGGDGALDLRVTHDPRLGRPEEAPAMLLQVVQHPGDPQRETDFMRSYLAPHQLDTLLGLLAPDSPSGSLDLIFPEDAPNWWLRLTRREPGESAPQLELRRLDPESGVAEREAVALSQADADRLRARAQQVFAEYSAKLPGAGD